MKSSIIIIANPASRTFSFKKVQQATEFLKLRGIEAKLLFTAYRDHACELAREALSEKPSVIVAAGGDGTINEVINGMYGSDIPLGILPLGTTNVLAKELSIPTSVSGALGKIVSGSPVTVSLGKIVAPSQETWHSRYFCLMAGIGFDAKAVFDVKRSIKELSGEGAYILSGMRNLLNYGPEKLVFRVDGAEHHGYAAIIGKASRYGGNFKVTPDADIRDPFFYLCILTGSSRIDLLRFVMGILRKTHLSNPKVRYLRATEVSVRGAAHVQLDGDYFGTTPAMFTIEQNALRLMC